MVVRISDKTQNYSKVTKLLVKPYLKLLKVSRTEIKAFIREFEKITDDYTHSVNPTVVSMVIHPDLASRMNILKNYL